MEFNWRVKKEPGGWLVFRCQRRLTEWKKTHSLRFVNYLF